MGYYHDRVFYVTLIVVLLLEEVLGRPQALSELSRLDLQYLGVSSDLNTLGIGRPSYQTPVLLLFDEQLLLVLSLLSVGAGE